MISFSGWGHGIKSLEAHDVFMTSLGAIHIYLYVFHCRRLGFGINRTVR